MRTRKEVHYRPEIRTKEHGWLLLGSTSYGYKAKAYSEIRRWIKTHPEVIAARIVKQTTTYELNETVK